MAIIDDAALLGQYFQPKFKFRFVLSIDGIPSFLIKRAKKPQARNSQTQLSYMNRTKYFKGRTKYQPAQFTIIDSIDPNSAQLLQTWQLKHSDPSTGRDGSPGFYQIKQITLTQVGAAGQIVNRWTYYDCWLTDIDFGDNDANDDTSTGQIVFTMRYNKYALQA